MGDGNKLDLNQELPKRRIVVIDDDVDAAETLAALLGLMGHEAVAAFDGPSGLDIVRRHGADIVFLDLGMPFMDGFAVARHLRDDEEFSKVYVVALTGFDQPSDVQATLGSGFHAHITKPPPPEVVREALRRASAMSIGLLRSDSPLISI